MVIEVATFRLAPDADEAAFLEADRRVQTEVMATLGGFRRRTTARGAPGEWLVLVLWSSSSDADAAAGRVGDHPAMRDFTALVDAASVSLRRYTTLD